MVFEDLDPDENEDDLSVISDAKKLEIHRQRLTDTKRKIKLLLAAVLVALGECLPLGVLQARPFIRFVCLLSYHRHSAADRVLAESRLKTEFD